MTSTYCQGHEVARRLKFCNHSVERWHEVASTLATVDYVRGWLQRSPVSTVNMDLLSICSCFQFSAYYLSIICASSTMASVN